MSYILDALRKADAQRESDPARGIHAGSPAIAAAASTTAWPLVAGATAVLAAAALLMWPQGESVAPLPAAPEDVTPLTRPASVLPPAPPPALHGARAPSMPAAPVNAAAQPMPPAPQTLQPAQPLLPAKPVQAARAPSAQEGRV